MSIRLSARPYDFSLDPGHAALLIIDMQRDLPEK
jgi:isochorismate hydrolase